MEFRVKSSIKLVRAITHHVSIFYLSSHRMQVPRSVPRSTPSILFSQPASTFVSTRCQSMGIHSEVWASWATRTAWRTWNQISVDNCCSPSATNVARCSCGTLILGNKGHSLFVFFSLLISKISHRSLQAALRTLGRGRRLVKTVLRFTSGR